ncbi:MAG: metal-dependent hydrolase [Desulfovibrionaceae bacterium]|nr:metal-dependent hydrolase [Desulfovibrionaceae bacterium]
MATLQYLGHAAFYLEGQGIKALFDPFLSGNPLASEGPEVRPILDYIFVSHAHDDHLGDTEAIARRTGAVVVATNELALYLEGKGLKTIAMHVGGRVSLSFGRVKLTPALHGSSVSENGRVVCADQPCGFLVEVEGKKIYHAGDTGLSMEMSLLAAEEVEVAILPIGGHYVMDAEDAARAVELIRPKITVPVHYDTFPSIRADPVGFARKAGGLTEARVLRPGESLHF